MPCWGLRHTPLIHPVREKNTRTETSNNMNVGEHSANERVSALSTTDNDSAAARQAQPINSFFKPDQVPVASPADFAAVQSTAAAAGTTTDPNTAATARAQQPVASLLAAAPAAHTRIAEESTRVCPTAVAGSAAAVQLTCSGAFPIPLSTSAYRYLPVSFSCRITPLEDSATVASTDSRTTSVTIRPHHNTTLLERAAGTGICSGSSQAVFFTPPFITPLNTTPLHPLRVCRSGITPHTLSDPFLACARGTLSPGLHKIPHPLRLPRIHSQRPSIYHRGDTCRAGDYDTHRSSILCEKRIPVRRPPTTT